MLSVALLSLFVTAALPASGAGAQSAAVADPPVRISLDRRTYQPGDRARITVRVRDDGYLTVLQLSADGYVRVLFPLDPGDDNFVRGAQSYEIRGRGDRDAFTVDAASGTGTVYAAWSREPFRFDDFVRGDHWDYRVLWDSALPRDPEAGFTNIVQRMSTAHFDYDVQSYFVQRQVAYAPMYDPVPYSGSFASCAFSTWYDPWCSAYYPYYGSGFGFGITIGFGAPFRPFYGPRFYDPFFYDPYYYGFRRCYYCGPTVVVINRPRYPGFYGYPVRSAPFHWKAGSPGGGGVIGVQYRPRSTYASTAARPVSPLFFGSRYRIAGEQPVLRTPVRATGAAGGYTGLPDASPVRAGRRMMEQGPASTVSGPRRAEPIPIGGASGTSSGGQYRGPARAGDGSSPPRAISPRDVQRRAEPSVDVPRPREPRASEPQRSAEPRSPQPRNMGRRAEPLVVTPYPDAPRASAPRSSDPRAVEPRSADPRPVEPRRAEPRTPDRYYDATPRSTPRASEPRASEPRVAQPRVMEPRAIESPRQVSPRAAPAPRAVEPRMSAPRDQPSPPARGGGERGGRGARG
jgi:hypothetical protein